MKLNRLLLFGALCTVPAHAAESDADALKRLRAEIVDMIGNPTCTNVVYCRMLPLGSLPCGGPSEYLAYAGTRTGNTGLLETKAAEYSFLQDELRKGQKEVGACVMLPVPMLACVNSRCTLR
jgi:hypothetical protein